MAKVSAYSFKNVVASIDRRDVKGLWDGDDSITVAMAADQGARTVGADGSSIFSISADQSANITIRLQHTSPTHRFLMQKWNAQKTRGAAANGFPFAVKDTVSGEGGTATDCRIMTAPADSKGKAATVREWVLSAGEWKPEIPNG